MTTTLMPDEQQHDSESNRESLADRVRAHRARRAKQYGRDRNDAELDTDVQREALEFQAQVQQARREASWRD